MKNYLVYPTKKMYISQTYSGGYSHSKSSTGTPSDYPIDESCGSSAKDYFYCPCDEVVIKKIYGVGVKGTNTIWMESTSKVILANGKESFVTIMVIHPNDDTLKDIKVGQKFKRLDKMFVEGNDGNATGNHFHISVSASKYVSGGWQENSKGAWVIKGSPIKPENAFFVDSNFTQIIDSKGLKFKNLTKVLGNPVLRDTTKDQIEVFVDELRLRTSPFGDILGYIKPGIYDVLDTEENGGYTWYLIGEDLWIASKEDDWTKYYPQDENSSENIEDVNDNNSEDNIFIRFFKIIVGFIVKLFKH